MALEVLDWQTDFIPGRTILDQIEQAATRSVGGIFLFTKDDDLADHGQAELAVPRGNVVIGLKGKHNGVDHPRIRFQDANRPWRRHYASLRDKNAVEPIERTLKAFMDAI